ncbi:hypothetical protein LEP1GSC195_2315 [Leptospira wolbachii serovar Codice str. CDC]|uniref:Uncharacterized protein n=1 Tax=Leptospira wolbachii serovar Codice str. CDC TaxID=1218599 RepID=R9A3B5_9LEPT|nr:hypothetical protein LEP1GSC195_2315 [Leptospira wolbachii serovar Codice str. CDC]
MYGGAKFHQIIDRALRCILFLRKGFLLQSDFTLGVFNLIVMTSYSRWIRSGEGDET